jgi:hypothetical protein
MVTYCLNNTGILFSAPFGLLQECVRGPKTLIPHVDAILSPLKDPRCEIDGVTVIVLDNIYW